MNVLAAVARANTSASYPLNTSDPRDTPDLPPFQVFVESGKGSSKWLVQTKTPILQMAKLGPERVQIYQRHTGKEKKRSGPSLTFVASPSELTKPEVLNL